MKTKYDAIIIGSGQGGTPLAKKLAGAGYNTALIERRWVGGTCVNDGCRPTKAMVASAKAAWQVKNSEQLGIHVEKYTTDIETIITRQQKWFCLSGQVPRKKYRQPIILS
jgi:pyruvate/2-oxoglutarate dehydrogenase complex dihydrolipoamide dehydrogenase (E3) component